ncbi:ImmA/IrrE family metallo-endopeptidase [Piscibacillus sp. B03]|uniref:ImmA/IrrE family metallo-endopeptidase n=1 Tax=Piscibacillus sp. B03 TaxID=3457430 RepID=UPI003FCDC225
MYELLLQEIEENNILLKETPIKGKIKGLYGDNVIWLNSKIETSIEKTCVLAEELGHHFTTAGDILDQSQTTNVKQEKLARLWAYNRLVPPEKLLDAFLHGCKSRYEVAEYLEVTEEFLENCIQAYKQKYGEKMKVGDHHVMYFNPLSIYISFE